MLTLFFLAVGEDDSGSGDGECSESGGSGGSGGSEESEECGEEHGEEVGEEHGEEGGEEHGEEGGEDDTTDWSSCSVVSDSTKDMTDLLSSHDLCRPNSDKTTSPATHAREPMTPSAASVCSFMRIGAGFLSRLVSRVVTDCSNFSKKDVP